MYKNILFLTFIAVFFTVSCKKKNIAPDASQNGQFSIEFDHIVGEETFQLNTRTYRNAIGEPFTINSLYYFISNIQLQKTDGTIFIVPQEESYFLINGADRNTRFTKVSVPEGDYTNVRFIIGVDSLRSTMPVENRKGVLSFNPDTGHEGGGMYWGWNSGYIFFKMEGTSPVISDDQQGDPTGKKQFKYHIGGFGGYSAPTINNIKTIDVNLNNAGIAQVRKGLRSNVHLFVNLMQLFNGPHTFSIAAHPNVMFSEYSTQIATNFLYLFTHDHTENFVKGDDDL